MDSAIVRKYLARGQTGERNMAHPCAPGAALSEHSAPHHVQRYPRSGLAHNGLWHGACRGRPARAATWVLLEMQEHLLDAAYITRRPSMER